MSTPFRDQVIISVVGATIGAIISGVVTFSISERTRALEMEKSQVEIKKLHVQVDTEKQRIEGATTIYIDLINKALGEVEDELNRKEGPSKLTDLTDRLVKTRNQFREALREIEANLDGEFDVISSALASGEPDERQLRQAVVGFRNAWPAKSAALQLALKKFLDTLGLSS
jgi:hypothetical protein